MNKALESYDMRIDPQTSQQGRPLWVAVHYFLKLGFLIWNARVRR